jgi:tRNA threonylcarbamoyladenosine biosynthesis protein TsaB
MLVLGIETSTLLSSVALWGPTGPVAEMMLAKGRGHVEFLMPAINDVCERADVSMKDVTGIAVGLGPGLFTGMRVGLATAKTIARTLRVPIVGVSSLDLLAFGVRYSPKLICACTDARRHEVFAAFYRQAPGGVLRLSDYRAWDPAGLAGELIARREEVLFVGNGAAVYREDLAEVGGEMATGGTQFPSAQALCELAIPRFEREETTPVALIEPLYVRRSDAEINWEARGVTIERPLRVRLSKRAQAAQENR